MMSWQWAKYHNKVLPNVSLASVCCVYSSLCVCFIRTNNTCACVFRCMFVYCSNFVAFSICYYSAIYRYRYAPFIGLLGPKKVTTLLSLLSTNKNIAKIIKHHTFGSYVQHIQPTAHPHTYSYHLFIYSSTPNINVCITTAQCAPYIVLYKIYSYNMLRSLYLILDKAQNNSDIDMEWNGDGAVAAGKR